MTVIDADEPFLGQLNEIGSKMQAEWLEQAGEKGQAIIDAYENL